MYPALRTHWFVESCYDASSLASMAFATMFVCSQRGPYLDERMELERIHIATNDFVTPSRQLAAAVN